MATGESERDRLLFFGGCSMSYGLVSEMISQAFPDYQVLNLGVIGELMPLISSILSRIILKKETFLSMRRRREALIS
ncbi:MAG: hypothetical protein ACLR06_09875 [Christensenellaceae bacterium]